MSQPQSYPNHRQYVPGYHFVALGLLTVVLVWSVVRLVRSFTVVNVMVVLALVGVGLVANYARAFALRAQDRVIRLEERLRMERLLPDDLKRRLGDLGMSDYIALRFAPDGELPGLVQRVLAGELVGQDAIKRAIKEWRPDPARV